MLYETPSMTVVSIEACYTGVLETKNSKKTMTKMATATHTVTKIIACFSYSSLLFLANLANKLVRMLVSATYSILSMFEPQNCPTPDS